jgi:hypothetical protein
MFACISGFPIHWQPNFEACFAGPGFKFNFTAMTVAHDAIADDQAKTSAGADGLRREEWFEEMRLHVSRNSGAIVHNFNNDLIILQTRADADLSCAVHGVNGVVDEIGPDLIQFAAVGRDAR